MRYQPTHAAPRDAVPFVLRGPKSLRTVLSAAVASAIGLTPALMFASPAQAAVANGSYVIGDSSVTEGGVMAFTVTRAAPPAGDTLGSETLNWSTGGGNATAGTDYTAVTTTATTGTVTFPATSSTLPQTQTIYVTTLQDQDDEADDENFVVTLAKPAGAPAGLTLTDATATGTIIDDDNPTFTLTATPNTVNEGAPAGQLKSTIRATLSRVSPFDVTIPVSTKDGTAKAGQDYTGFNGAITIDDGDLFDTVEVDVLNDNIDEPSIQSFTVDSSAGSNVAGTQSVTVNIEDDDAAPVINLAAGGNVSEGGTLTFNATLSRLSESTVTARWDTADGPATTPGNAAAKAGDDYMATTNGTLTFTPLTNTPTQAITVKTNLDSVDEATEDLQVKLSQAANGTLAATPAATGSIIDSGTTPGPQVTLMPTTVPEGDMNTSRARTFKVTLSKASGREQKVTYQVAAGTANPGAGIGAASDGTDFTAISSPVTLTFASGETEKTFTVDIMGDNIDEGNGENIAITLGDLGGGLAAGQSLGANQVTITDDDDKPVFSIGKSDLTMPEGNGPSAILFEVKLSNPSSRAVDWEATAATNPAGTATLGDDFEALTQLDGTFAPGQTSAYVLFVVNGDDVNEPTESIRYTFARDVGEDDATGGPLTASVVLTNDDEAPDLEVTSAKGDEGGTVKLKGIVTGTSESSTLLNITLAGKSMGGKQAATATDFSPTSFQVIIPANTVSGKEIAIGDVLLVDDAIAEPDETILVNGVGFAQTGTVTDGVITIASSDGGTTNPPTNPGDPASVTLMGPEAVLKGAQFNLTGKTEAGKSVQLWSAPVNGGADDWDEDGDPVTANASGNFSFPRTLSTMGKKYVAHSGATKSTEVKVWLKQAPALSVTSPATGQAKLHVTGGTPGGAFLVQRNTGSGWTTLGSQRTLASNGNQYVTLAGQPSGRTVSYRVYVYGATATGIQAATTPLKSVRVR